MSTDIYMQPKGIGGESTDEAHKEWMELESASYSMSQPVATTASSSSGAARANFGDVTVHFRTQKGSSDLMLKCANGAKIPEVIIQFHRATGVKQLYLEIKLTDAYVSSFMTIPPAGVSFPMDTVTYTYKIIEFVYTETDHKTGKPKGQTKFGWNRETNKPHP